MIIAISHIAKVEVAIYNIDTATNTSIYCYTNYDDNGYRL